MKRSNAEPKARPSFKDRRGSGKKAREKKSQKPYHAYIPTGKEKAANID